MPNHGRPKGKPNITSAQRGQAIALLGQGWSAPAVARELNLNPQQVYRLRQKGAEYRMQTHPRIQELEALNAQLQNQLATYTELIRRLHEAFSLAGLPTPP